MYMKLPTVAPASLTILFEFATCSIQYIVKDCYFLAKNFCSILEHSLYSPDLTPIDFFLFLKLKEVIKGHHLETIMRIKTKLLCLLKEIPAEYYQACFHALKQRTRCVSKFCDTTAKMVEKCKKFK